MPTVKFTTHATRTIAALALACACHGASARIEQGACLPYSYAGHGFSPKDYSKSTVKEIDIVERYHFTPQVEALQRGNTTADPIGDVTYTLARFPNHYRALLAASRYARRPGKKSMEGHLERLQSPDCYFWRAFQMFPSDAKLFAAYGVHLASNGRHKEAAEAFEDALKLNENMLDARYNLGLARLKLGNKEEARRHAEIVYGRGYPLPGLRRQLKAAGIEITPRAPGTSPAAPSAAADPAPQGAEPAPATTP
ncbi:MAG: tetratricopeptide repeat protein [Gammaproteobacteria bacterium]